MAEASKPKTGDKGKATVDVEPCLSQRLKELPGEAFEHKPFTIFKVPDSIRQCDRSLYKPFMLAIGPYHRKDGDLHAMEALKLQYLRDLLSRGQGTSWEERLEKCKRQIRAREARARRHYADDIDLSGEKFVEMLLLDGCFIIEYMTKASEADWKTLLRPGWSWNLIRSDLIVLENQIPFFVLDVLHNVLLGSEPNCWTVDGRSSTLRRLAAEALTMGEMKVFPDFIFDGEFQHLLHLRYACDMPFPNPWKQQSPASCESVVDCFIISICSLFCWTRRAVVAIMHHVYCLYLRIVSLLNTYIPWARYVSMKVKKGFFWLCPCLRYTKPLPRASSKLRTIPCATELDEAGIRFKEKAVDEKNVNNFLEISFDRRGNMVIPRLEVYDSTKPLLMNLVAFEQCNEAQAHKVFTSYAFLMDGLINTPKDVAVLRNCGVLKNYLSTDEELAQFFNQLCKSIALIPDMYFYHDLVNSVWKYYESKWPRWRAKLMRDYFSNPWAFLSLGAAVILLVLTITQTTLALLVYFCPPS